MESDASAEDRHVVRAGPRMWWKCLRDGICLERMHRAFDRKLMAYGMIQGVKA